MVKILFCSISDRPKFSDKIYNSNNLYYKRYNCDVVYENKTLCNDRHIAWSKILLLQRELNKDYEGCCAYDYVIWIDDDILIMNHKIDIRDIINKYDIQNIMVDNNNNYSHWKINTGIIVCKNNDMTKNILKEIWETADTKHYFGGVWENDTMNDYNNIHNTFKVIPHKTIQSFKCCYTDGDFSIHFAGIKCLKTRIELRDFYLKQISEAS